MASYGGLYGILSGLMKSTDHASKVFKPNVYPDVVCHGF